MNGLAALRELPAKDAFGKNDVLVIFGEVFESGYVNGLIDAATSRGMKVIYSTVGRRDSEMNLRPLTNEELATKQQPLVNIPLEAGFDLVKHPDGSRAVDLLQGYKMSEWENLKLDWKKVEEYKNLGVTDFRKRVTTWTAEIEKQIPADANVVIAHTMAGGFPRAKLVMPVANRVFKGFGDRYLSSKTFWESDLGTFCSKSFYEVTGETLQHLLEITENLRNRQSKHGKKVSYVGYGYHGTEVLMNGEFRWQGYSPYLQGWAKLHLEDLSAKWNQKGVPVCIFNCPEILTNSTTIFLGVEVSLYPLLGALRKAKTHQKVLDQCEELLKEGQTLNQVLAIIDNYLSHPTVKAWSELADWPKHNGPEQMELMRTTSSDLIAMHKSEDDLITRVLSDLVFKNCGEVMLRESANIQKPVWWIGHDLISKF